MLVFTVSIIDKVKSTEDKKCPARGPQPADLWVHWTHFLAEFGLFDENPTEKNPRLGSPRFIFWPGP
jgi:hypothetical protein